MSSQLSTGKKAGVLLDLAIAEAKNNKNRPEMTLQVDRYINDIEKLLHDAGLYVRIEFYPYG